MKYAMFLKVLPLVSPPVGLLPPIGEGVPVLREVVLGTLGVLAETPVDPFVEERLLTVLRKVVLGALDILVARPVDPFVEKRLLVVLRVVLLVVLLRMLERRVVEAIRLEVQGEVRAVVDVLD